MLAKYHGIAQNIEVPPWVITAAKRIIYKFAYRGIDKITRTMASKPISEGGINPPLLDDIMAAAGIQWLRKARRYPNRLWAKFIYKDMKKLGGLGCVSALRTWREYDSDEIYQFNRYLIKCWEHLKREETMNENTFLGQTIWKNRRFSCIKNKTQLMLHSTTYFMSKGYMYKSWGLYGQGWKNHRSRRRTFHYMQGWNGLLQ